MTKRVLGVKPNIRCHLEPLAGVKISGYSVEVKGYTIIPLKLYFKDGRVKAEIALARGKREYDKRQALREAQDKREALRAMRNFNKR